jgi:hypothetical protein
MTWIRKIIVHWPFQDGAGNFLTNLPILRLSLSNPGYTSTLRQVVPGLFAVTVAPNLLVQVS